MTTKELIDYHSHTWTLVILGRSMSQLSVEGFEILSNAYAYIQCQYLGIEYRPHHSTKSIFTPESQDATSNHP